MGKVVHIFFQMFLNYGLSGRCFCYLVPRILVQSCVSGARDRG
jgi:hypothetical protein